MANKGSCFGHNFFQLSERTASESSLRSVIVCECELGVATVTLNNRSGRDADWRKDIEENAICFIYSM